MSIENDPSHQPYPDASEDWEVFFDASLEALVDTLFTHGAIAQKVRETEPTASVDTFIRQQRGVLFSHLRETTELTVINILADIDTLGGPVHKRCRPYGKEFPHTPN
jgi:hypothetical protein